MIVYVVTSLMGEDFIPPDDHFYRTTFSQSSGVQFQGFTDSSCEFVFCQPSRIFGLNRGLWAHCRHVKMALHLDKSFSSWKLPITLSPQTPAIHPAGCGPRITSVSFKCFFDSKRPINSIHHAGHCNNPSNLNRVMIVYVVTTLMGKTKFLLMYMLVILYIYIYIVHVWIYACMDNVNWIEWSEIFDHTISFNVTPWPLWDRPDIGLGLPNALLWSSAWNNPQLCQELVSAVFPRSWSPFSPFWTTLRLKNVPKWK